MIDPGSDREMRDALVTSERDARPGDSCLTPERIWVAVRGEASPGEIREALRHVAACGVCSEAWRIARDVSEDAAVPAARKPARMSRIAAVASAAVLAATALLVLERDRPHPSPRSYRQEAATETVEAVTPDGASLPRSSFVLRWRDLGQATRYDVTVYTEDLRLVGRARDLDRPEYTVPAEAFRDLPAGTRLVWKVAANLPDGRRVSSGAFLVVVADDSRP